MTGKAPPFVLPILIGAGSLGMLASTIYVPSIPDMARSLAVPVGPVQLTVTAFAFAFGVGTLLVGPLSDRFGRRTVLVASTLICLFASLICAFALSIEMLMAGRLMQALGACAGLVLGRAAARDMFDRDGTGRAIAMLAGATSLVPIMAPMVGGYIQVWFGWRANFLIIALFSLLLVMAMLWLLPETNTRLQNQLGLVRGLIASFGTLLRSRRFIGHTLGTTGGGAGFYSFITAGPVILIDGYGLSPAEFGIFAGMIPFGFLAGSFVTNRLVGKIDLDRLLLGGGAVIVTAGLVLAMLAGTSQPWIFILPCMLVGFGNGITIPTAYSSTVSIYPHLAGAAAGLSNFVQMMTAAIAALVMSQIELHSALPLGAAFMSVGATILAGALLARRTPL